MVLYSLFFATLNLTYFLPFLLVRR